MILVVERANEDPKEYHWDDGIKLRFKFDEADIKQLESGEVLWRGTTGYYLEEE